MVETHVAIQTNDFEERLRCWRRMLSNFFFFDKTHYARYGTFYVNSIENIGVTHRGAKTEMQKFSEPVRRNNYSIGQSIDLAGEQTYTKSAKTVGGTTSFQIRQGAVLKSVLNRPFPSKLFEPLKELSGVKKTTTNVKKCLRPSEILKYNQIVLKIQGVMKEQFVDTFDESLDIGKLYNLVSRRPISNVIAESLLHFDSSGGSSLHSFEQRLHTDTPSPFFDPMKRKKQPTVKSDEMNLKLPQKGD